MLRKSTWTVQLAEVESVEQEQTALEAASDGGDGLTNQPFSTLLASVTVCMVQFLEYGSWHLGRGDLNGPCRPVQLAEAWLLLSDERELCTALEAASDAGTGLPNQAH